MVNNVGDPFYVTQKSGGLQKKKVIAFVTVTCNATCDHNE